MEKIPESSSSSHVSELVHDTAAYSEEMMQEITNLKREIALTESRIEEVRNEFESLMASLDMRNIQDQQEAARLQETHDSFLTVMQRGLENMQESLTNLEEMHGSSLQLFEEAKNAAEESIDIPNTIH
jgi:chromosome segregation ATPase